MPFRNQFRSEFFAGSTGVTGLDFNFDAMYIRVRNKGGVPVHFSLNSTVATSGDPEILPGGKFEASLPPVSAMGVMTTSTTTSTAGEDTLVAVEAWG